MKDLFGYIDNTIKIIYSNYGDDNRNLGNLFDWLGDVAGFIQLNELYQFCCADDCGNLFEFTNEDEVFLMRNGYVELKATGETIEDYKDSHKDIYNWFFNIKEPI